MEVLFIPTIGAAVLVIALAGMFAASFVTRNKDTPKEMFAGILSLFVGGAIGSALLATPVVTLAVMPLAKVLKLQTEPVLMSIDVFLYAAGFVISGTVCWKGIVKDMRTSRNRRRTQEVETLSKKA